MPNVCNLWLPAAGSTGLRFAGPEIDGDIGELVHAAPRVLDVTVSPTTTVPYSPAGTSGAARARPDSGRHRHANTVTLHNRRPPTTTPAASSRHPAARPASLRQWGHAADHRECAGRSSFYGHR